jgi:hypothetical protein
MSDFSLNFDGVEELDVEFGERAEDWTGGGTAYAGTAVNYAVYVEFGTSKMDPRPYLRPAVSEAKSDLEEFIDENTNTTARSITSASDLVQTVALALERRVKEIITEKGIIDTGTLRASIRAVDSEAELVAADGVSI